MPDAITPPPAEPNPEAAVDLDIAKALWYFYTPTAPWETEAFTPESHQTPVDALTAIPEVERPLVDLSMNGRLPQYNDPNWFSKPFDTDACTCCAFYDNWQTVYSFTVGDTEMVIITGVSYEAPGIPPYCLFQVQVLRDSEVVASWEDMKVSAAPNPAQQFAFSGHTDPMPIWIRCDRNQRISVRFKLLGVYPYNVDPATQYSEGFCVLIHGFRSTIFDNRDGAPRPNEPGDLAQADLQPSRVAGEAETEDARKLREEMTNYLRYMLAPNPPGLGS